MRTAAEKYYQSYSGLQLTRARQGEEVQVDGVLGQGKEQGQGQTRLEEVVAQRQRVEN